MHVRTMDESGQARLFAREEEGGIKLRIVCACACTVYATPSTPTTTTSVMLRYQKVGGEVRSTLLAVRECCVQCWCTRLVVVSSSQREKCAFGAGGENERVLLK